MNAVETLNKFTYKGMLKELARTAAPHRELVDN
jgi:hypothetical protein